MISFFTLHFIIFLTVFFLRPNVTIYSVQLTVFIYDRYGHCHHRRHWVVPHHSCHPEEWTEWMTKDLRCMWQTYKSNVTLWFVFNLCRSFRGSEWLGFHPGNPCLAGRQAKILQIPVQSDALTTTWIALTISQTHQWVLSPVWRGRDRVGAGRRSGNQARHHHRAYAPSIQGPYGCFDWFSLFIQITS